MLGKLFYCKRKGTDLYIAERDGSWARWSSKREGIKQTKDWWAMNLNFDVSNYLEFEECI